MAMRSWSSVRDASTGYLFCDISTKIHGICRVDCSNPLTASRFSCMLSTSLRELWICPRGVLIYLVHPLKLRCVQLYRCLVLEMISWFQFRQIHQLHILYLCQLWVRITFKACQHVSNFRRPLGSKYGRWDSTTIVGSRDGRCESCKSVAQMQRDVLFVSRSCADAKYMST